MLHTLYDSTDDASLNSVFMCKNAPAQIFLTPDRPFFQRIKTKLPKRPHRGTDSSQYTSHAVFILSSIIQSKYQKCDLNVRENYPWRTKKKVQNDKLVHQHIQFSFIGIKRDVSSLFPVFPYVKTSCITEGERAREGEKALASADSRLTAQKVNWSLGEWLWWPIFNRTTYKCLNVWFLLSYRKMDLVIFFCMTNVLGQGLWTGYWVSALDKSEHQSYITQLMS